MPFRVAYIVTHPIQYQAPLVRYLSRTGDLDLRVFFLSDFSSRQHYERGFKKTISWDVPLTEGYTWEVLPRLGRRRSATTLQPWWPVACLRDRLREGDFDAVWAHGWGHVGLCQFIHHAASLGLPVLLRGESAAAVSRRNWKSRLRDDFYLRWLFGRVAAFLCIGTENRRFYKQYGISEDRLFSVPYAVDNAFFQAGAARAARQRETFRRILGLQQGRPIVLFAGKFVKTKAPAELLFAFGEVHRRSASAKAPYLLFAGDGPLRGALEEQAKPLGDAVRFLGFCNQTKLPVFYDLCDVFVLPSRFEPWGLVLNEAMNAGRPVIASDRVGAGADLVSNGDNGFVYPSGDAGMLGARLTQILESPRLRIAMGEQSLRRINGWNFAADRRGLLEALASVCRNRTPRLNEAAG